MGWQYDDNDVTMLMSDGWQGHYFRVPFAFQQDYNTNRIAHNLLINSDNIIGKHHHHHHPYHPYHQHHHHHHMISHHYVVWPQEHLIQVSFIQFIPTNSMPNWQRQLGLSMPTALTGSGILLCSMYCRSGSSSHIILNLLSNSANNEFGQFVLINCIL